MFGAFQIASLDREFLVEHVDLLDQLGRDRLELGELLDRRVDLDARPGWAVLRASRPARRRGSRRPAARRLDRAAAVGRAGRGRGHLLGGRPREEPGGDDHGEQQPIAQSERSEMIRLLSMVGM